jgi:hypothetical protein
MKVVINRPPKVIAKVLGLGGSIVVNKVTIPSQIVEVPALFASGVIQFIFDTPALEWIITHNKNTTKFVETIMSKDGNKLYCNVKIIDLNSFTIFFTSATSGYVNVAF